MYYDIDSPYNLLEYVDKTTIGPRSKLPALKARAQSTSAFPEEAMRKAVTFPDPRQGFAVTIKSASPSPSRSQSTIQLPMDAIAKANSQVAISLSNRETRTQKQWFTEFWSEDVASREHLRNRELLDACIGECGFLLIANKFSSFGCTAGEVNIIVQCTSQR